MKRIALNTKTLFYKHDQVLADNERLRHALREFRLIADDEDLPNGLARVALSKCIRHALKINRPAAERLPKGNADV